jgi:hypothetical protein
MINLGLWLTYLLLGVAIVLVIAFPLIHIIRHPQQARDTFIGLGILVGVFILSLLLSGGEANEKYNITAAQSKMIGAGLTMIYLLAAGAILAVFYTGIKNMLNK